MYIFKAHTIIEKKYSGRSPVNEYTHLWHILIVPIHVKKAGRRGGSGEPLLISEVVRGSPAHRSGTMQPGDRLLAIDSTRLEHLTLEDARAILQCCDDIVTLRVQKDELYSGL